MIFCGDIALPYNSVIKIVDLPSYLSKQQWIGNLEGTLINPNDEISKLLKRQIVFNSKDAIDELCLSINFKIFNLANNHILDVSSIDTTISFLAQSGISYVGAGKNEEEARKEVPIKDFGKEYVLISFGWEAIKCTYATKNTEGVNPYIKENVFKQVKLMLDKHKNKRIICLFHWNYELELYPQPFDRDLSHKLIDLGVFAIIGCHSHRVQPIEIYKGKPIVYGLGNFLFPQSVFMNKLLKFPDYSLSEILFEIDKNDNFIIHRLFFERESFSLKYIDSKVLDKTTLSSYNTTDYISFFKKNRIQKKLLPIILYEDNKYLYKLKLYWIKLRNHIITMLVKNRNVFRLLKALISKFA